MYSVPKESVNMLILLLFKDGNAIFQRCCKELVLSKGTDRYAALCKMKVDPL
jgi:hypothetical protein